MNISLVEKPSFDVIGKVGQGYAKDSMEWVPPLWKAANENFHEIAHLAKKDSLGNLAGFWGAMSDIQDNFERWDEQGKYMAGCEVESDAVAPDGWKKWVIPSYKFIVAKCTQEYSEVFSYVLNEYVPENHYQIVGAIHEYYCPQDKNGELSLYFPIEKL